VSDNGIGPLKAKAGGSAKTLRYSLRMNTEKHKQTPTLQRMNTQLRLTSRFPFSDPSNRNNNIFQYHFLHSDITLIVMD